MRTVAILALFASLQFSCTQMPTANGNGKSAEAVVPEIARSFSACELDALLKNYAPNAEFVSPSTPTPLVGQNALREHFAGACSGPVRPIMKVEAQRVRTLSPDSAVVTGTYSFGRSDRPNDKPWRAYFVFGLVRAGTGWLVVSQETMPMPAG